MPDRDDETFLSPAELLTALLGVRRVATDAEAREAPALDELPASTRASGVNLVHYLAIRGLDLRREQRSLARLGLSSLGRAEPHVLATIDATITRLAAEVGEVALPDDLGRRGPTADEARQLLTRHTLDALGPTEGERTTRLMVTLPTEAAHDAELVERLVRSGMTVARINAAHDDLAAWQAMAANVRRASTATGHDVKVMVDLPGPKLRTGPMPLGAEVVRVRPVRDELGRVRRPAVLRLTDEPGADALADPEPGRPATIPLTGMLLEHVRAGDELRLRDARGRRRTFTVTSTDDDGCHAEGDRTSYLTPGLAVSLRRGSERVAKGAIGRLPTRRPSIQLRAGDTLELRPGTASGAPTRIADDGTVIEPAHVSIEVAELFGSVRPGDRVLLDDGGFLGIARDVDDERIALEIVRPERGRLRPGKGVNLPDTELPIPGLTADDVAIVESFVHDVDLVAMSFVSGADDVHRLHQLLERLGADHTGVVLKIERKAAVDELPRLLLATLSRPPTALMVARGDLAVEVGFEWLPEIQEEVLWFGAAGHVPVILATQILESFAKQGAPTRAEVTDAAWASRAECVMLNKGPFIPEVLEFLDELLTRMETRREKRTPMLRQLSSSLPWGDAP